MAQRLGFRGGAWIYRDRQKIEVSADLFSEDNADGPRRWRGTYDLSSGADIAAIEPGIGYMRFSDGTDARVRLLANDGSRGSFEVIGELGTLEPDMTRFRGARREASAQDPLDDWPKPAGT